MRGFSTAALMAIVASVAAIPITPAAPALQRRAEVMRSEGMAEHDIAEQLSIPLIDNELEHQPFLDHVTSRLYAVFRTPSEEEKRDQSGDIAPGSLESPQMLPRAAAPQSFADTISQKFGAVFRGQDFSIRDFGYEGKELELRRPTGMRHWD
ncbi:hypothetical protein BU24DRAFT_461684 [Aaosphaeria arxii CBS 175.79]|uniref:Uncharacterized protein n=1 Tax=Aaosphaeria arxii CBS 175.79 TaxID=1450172 RepID=A0A6A5XQ99_9PLEO|nr:uncharacterized protein BU24DRAFT_461684 [Aaosphaeria arxii CBS 175.79]KAF2015438.1 hypothetical protein BU24DRAFT_461684 [Aaosphaeria arxii CBS 175.79]